MTSTCVFLDTCSTVAAVAISLDFTLFASSGLGNKSPCLLVLLSCTGTAATRTCSPCWVRRCSSRGPLHARPKVLSEWTDLLELAKRCCNTPDGTASLEGHTRKSARQQYLIIQRHERKLAEEFALALGLFVRHLKEKTADSTVELARALRRRFS